MTAEDILEALAARQALESTPQPWLDAARGVISPAEAARRAQGQEDPALVERSMQLFAPNPAADEQRLRQLLAQGFAPPPRAWRGAFAVALGLLAALVLALVMPWGGGPPGSSPSTRWALELERGAALDRAAEPSTPSDVVRFYADRDLRATLRPWDAVQGRVAAAVYTCEGTVPRRLPVEPRAAPGGVVVVESGVAALGLGVGTWELLFVVGTAEPLPEPRTCGAEGLADQGDVQILRTRIEILPPPR